MNVEHLISIGAAALVCLAVLGLAVLAQLKWRRRRRDADGGASALQERIGALETLLAQTEQKVRELRKLLDEANRSGDDAHPNEQQADGRVQEVILLSGQGLGPVEIARRVDMPIGEVELVLNLRRSGRAGVKPTQLRQREHSEPC